MYVSSDSFRSLVFVNAFDITRRYRSTVDIAASSWVDRDTHKFTHTIVRARMYIRRVTVRDYMQILKYIVDRNDSCHHLMVIVMIISVFGAIMVEWNRRIIRSSSSSSGQLLIF